MEVTATALKGVLRIVPRRFQDGRGFFCETWNRRRMAAAGLDIDFVQDNQSRSALAGTVRGLHYQAPPHAQGKLVRVLRGAIVDIAVDVRIGSPSYGRWVAERLSAEDGGQLWVPRGFLHGFVTLEPDTDVLYKVDNYYDRESEGSVRFDDPELGIDWGIDGEKAILSEKDAAAPSFRDFRSPFSYSSDLSSSA